MFLSYENKLQWIKKTSGPIQSHFHFYKLISYEMSLVVSSAMVILFFFYIEALSWKYIRTKLSRQLSLQNRRPKSKCLISLLKLHPIPPCPCISEIYIFQHPSVKNGVGGGRELNLPGLRMTLHDLGQLALYFQTSQSFIFFYYGE